MTTITGTETSAYTFGVGGYLSIAASGNLEAGLTTLGTDTVVDNGIVVGIAAATGGAGAYNKHGSGGNGYRGRDGGIPPTSQEPLRPALVPSFTRHEA